MLDLRIRCQGVTYERSTGLLIWIVKALPAGLVVRLAAAPLRLWPRGILQRMRLWLHPAGDLYLLCLPDCHPDELV